MAVVAQHKLRVHNVLIGSQVNILFYIIPHIYFRVIYNFILR